MTPKPGVALKADPIRARRECEARHPLDPDSLVFFRPLSVPAGLERMVLRLGRLPSREAPNELHAHHLEEARRGKVLVKDRDVACVLSRDSLEEAWRRK